MAIEAYRLAANEFDYPLHLGITEAGRNELGTIKSCAGLAQLLYEGIEDTIRISLTCNPDEEVKVCKKLLNSLGLYSNMVDIRSCPTCGRLNFDMGPIVKVIKKQTKDMKCPNMIGIFAGGGNGTGGAKEDEVVRDPCLPKTAWPRLL